MTDRDVRNACHALLALQKQYAQLERAGEDTADSLELYRELELDIQAKGKLSEKYARTLILHPLFGETFQTPWARLLQPLLVFLQSTLEHHASLVNLLALEIHIVHSICTHLLSNLEELDPQDPTRLDDATLEMREDLILMMANILLTLYQDGSQAHLIRDCLQAFPGLETFAIPTLHFKKDEDLVQLRALFMKESKVLENIQHQVRAATKIQSCWRAFRQKRQYKTLQRGFGQLQRLFRRKLLVQDLSIVQKMVRSEEEFMCEYQTILDRKKATEERFQSLLQRPQGERGSPSESDEGSQDPRDESDDTFLAEEKAALVIQAAIRKWWVKSKLKPMWMHSFSHTQLTEEKIRQLQDEIDLWQQNHEAPTADLAELQELQQKAHFQYLAFNRSLADMRKKDHVTMSKIAQTQAILANLETPPCLEDYDASQRSMFMSLPLPVAVKARMDHKETMGGLNEPRWKRLLKDFG